MDPWIILDPPKSSNKLTTLKARILEGMQMWDVVWAQSYQHSRVYSAPHWLVWDCLFDILFKTLAARIIMALCLGTLFSNLFLAQECNLPGVKILKTRHTFLELLPSSQEKMLEEYKTQYPEEGPTVAVRGDSLHQLPLYTAFIHL